MNNYLQEVSSQVTELRKRVKEIEGRNERVEINKAWETSWTRRGLLSLFTYLALGLYLWAINVSAPWLNAVVPSVGFLLSTLTLPLFKKWWIGWRDKEKKRGGNSPLC